MPHTKQYANAILDWTFGKRLLPAISQGYIGLCTNDPETDGGTFNELSGETCALAMAAAWLRMKMAQFKKRKEKNQ